ncbi:MAG: hypothetical protein AAGM67_16045 [Bacteroidota bacterium]
MFSANAIPTHSFKSIQPKMNSTMHVSMFKNLLYGVCLVALTACSGCKGGVEEPFEIPDLVFNATITGAETKTISKTLEGGTATTFSAVASTVSVSDLFQIQAMETNQFVISIIRSSAGTSTGTFQLDGGIPEGISFSNQEAGTFYRSTSATLTITSSELFQNVGGAIGAGDTYYIDGNFSATLESETSPGDQIEMTGEFSGLALGAR